MGRPIITLLTDFGLDDPYVGIMKGIMLGICPEAQLVDLGHRLPPQDIAAGAYALSTAWPFFPEGTVHMAVVDPTVGSDRLPIALNAGGHFFVGPDNGLLESALARAEGPVYATTEPRWHHPGGSHTFHGRDIFAPVAAWLASGVPLKDLGPGVEAPVRAQAPQPAGEGGGLVGEVIFVDTFGNLITNITEGLVRDALHRGAQIEVKGARLPRLETHYAAVEPGELVAIIGSTGRLEISVRDGSAAERLGLKEGEAVRMAGTTGG